MYDGNWFDNRANGFGKYISEEVIYEGEWKNDKQEGKGIYYYASGDRRMGDYHNGNPIGRHAILTKNGEILSKDY